MSLRTRPTQGVAETTLEELQQHTYTHTHIAIQLCQLLAYFGSRSAGGSSAVSVNTVFKILFLSPTSVPPPLPVRQWRRMGTSRLVSTS